MRPALEGTINVTLPCTLQKCASDSCHGMTQIHWILVRLYWYELERETEGREYAG